MSLSIGIIGLPNVGKSTIFNALTRTQNAAVANYPFCTIEPNRAIVPVPDSRLTRLQAILEVPDAIPATVTFVDIAGLVEGASRGEGLGNQFLSHIRESDAILHIVRCFEDPNVAHVAGSLDPRRDIQTVNSELRLADLAQIERKMERLKDDVKGDPAQRARLQAAARLQDHLSGGHPAAALAGEDPEIQSLIAELRLLTAKPVIYCVNVAELESEIDPLCMAAARSVANDQGSSVLELRGKLEADLVEVTEEELSELLEIAGLEESALTRLIQAGYRTLDLLTFFTFNDQEVRAWTLPAGSTAPQAAGKVHSEMQAGFIKAEVVAYEDFIRHGSSSAVRAAGDLRIEGKDYRVQDGDILLFRFQA